jgi:hypothetical protein
MNGITLQSTAVRAAAAVVVLSWFAHGAAAAAPIAAAQDSSAPLPQVTITAAALEKKVHTFISAVSGVPYWSDDDPVALWRTPICPLVAPLVAGLGAADGQLLFDRLTDTLGSVGVPLGATGCRPNFFVIVTAQPEATLDEMWRRGGRMFGDGTGSWSFVHTTRAVRIWYNASFTDSDGAGPLPFEGVFGGFDGVPSFQHQGLGLRQEFVAVPHLDSVIAIVDYARVMGLDWHQVADYIVMAGLTKVDLDAKFGDSPTILRLFSSSADDRPQALSEWDKALLKELYSTSPTSRHQRLQVATRMLHDVAP